MSTARVTYLRPKALANGVVREPPLAACVGGRLVAGGAGATYDCKLHGGFALGDKVVVPNDTAHKVVQKGPELWAVAIGPSCSVDKEPRGSVGMLESGLAAVRSDGVARNPEAKWVESADKDDERTSQALVLLAPLDAPVIDGGEVVARAFEQVTPAGALHLDVIDQPDADNLLSKMLKRMSPLGLGTKLSHADSSEYDFSERSFIQDLQKAYETDRASCGINKWLRIQTKHRRNTRTVTGLETANRGSQRLYIGSRTTRRRKGGCKRKPLAQRHDAPD